MTRFDYIQNNTFEVSINLNLSLGCWLGKKLTLQFFKKIFYKKIT